MSIGKQSFEYAQTLVTTEEGREGLNGFRRLGADKVHETAEDRLGDVEVDGATLGVGKVDGLLDGADAEDVADVDDVLASQSDEGGLSIGEGGNLGFDGSKTEGHHKVGVGGVVDMGIVVVGLEVEHAAEVDDVKLVVSTQAKGRRSGHRLPKSRRARSKIRVE